MASSRRLQVESLEDRLVPANWGVPWPDAQHLTASFVPNGASLGGGQTNTLFQTLNAIAPTAVWERDVLYALQTWAVNANINIGLVNDGGQPMGAPGRLQGDPRFGDIRIAAGSFASDVLAFTQPFNPVAGTWSGDVQLNSNMGLGVSSSAQYDFSTVILHELGHSLGLADNSDPTSVMDATYHGVDTTPSASDIAALQAIYGPHPTNTVGNTSFATASSLSLLPNSSGVLSIGVNAQLNSMGDTNFYSFKAPSLTGGLTIQLQHDGLSLLTPHVTVFNSWGQVVGSAVSTDPTAADLTIQLNKVRSGGTYYVEVQGGSGTIFDIGSYQLNIQSVPVVNSLLGGLLGSGTAGNGLLGGLLGVVGDVVQTVTSILPLNLSFLTADLLNLGLFGPSAPAHASYQSSVTLSGQAGYYEVQAPAASTGDNVMWAMAWATGSSQLTPNVTAYDSNKNPISAQVLSNENQSEIIQLTGVTPGADYYIKVNSAASSGQGSTGNYTVAVNFGSCAVSMQNFVSSQLTTQASTQTGTLNVQTTDLFHFVLAVPANAGTGVTMTIVNSSGQVVAQLSVTDGQTESLTLSLNPDTYTFEFTDFSVNGAALSTVNFSLQGTDLGSEMGPQAQSSTSSPSQGGTSGGSTSTSGSGSGSGSSSSSGSGSTSTYNWSGSTGTTSGSSSTNQYSGGYTV